MKKLIFKMFGISMVLALVMAVSVPPVAALDTVSTSFTSTTAGSVLLQRRNETFTYAVSGSFVGTWILEVSHDGSNYKAIAPSITGTSTDTGTVHVEAGTGRMLFYRFRCSAYTSGTIVTVMVEVDDIVSEWVTHDLLPVMRTMDEGVYFPLGIDIDGGAAFEGGFVANEDGGAYDFRVESDDDEYAFFVDGDTDRVGISNSSPQASLDVQALLPTDTVLRVVASLSQAVDVVDVRSKEDTRFFRIDADGGILIVDGDATPTTAVDAGDLYIEEQLEVDGAVDFDSTLAVAGAFDLDGAMIQDGGTVVFNEAGGLYDVRMEGDSNTNLFLADGSTDRIGINTGTPLAALDVNPNLAADSVLSLLGVASQAGDMLSVRGNDDSVLHRISANGHVGYRQYTKAFVDTLVPDFVGALIQVSDHTDTYCVCKATGTAASDWAQDRSSTTGCGTNE